MRVIDADEARMIDLPGVGPCPRPVDIDQGITGFKRLKSLRIYRFRPGPAVHGDSEVDEVLILPLSGAFDMMIGGPSAAQATLTSAGPLRAMYMTPQHSYLLTPRNPVMVAYARAEAAGAVPSQALAGTASQGLAEHLWYRFERLGADLEVVGEALVHVIRGAVEGAELVAREGQTLALGAGEVATVRAIALAEVLIIGV